ncbi:MAG: DegT/DnrJ/EryC1/StrS family aminotransferase [Acetobacteraceae bacterium]|nr:DegT/DnrJ/EryC1/StrS family aminotransferase [Acetobacteraceae bacterium]
MSKIIEAVESKWIASGGPLVQRFEAAIREITGFRYVVWTASCTAALQLAFRVLNVREGDEVWCPTLTFIASVAPAVQLGAVPRLFDIDIATWTIDVSLIEEELSIAARKGNLPRVVVSTDLYGNPAKA